MKIALAVPSEFKNHFFAAKESQGIEIAGLLNWPAALGQPDEVKTIDEDLSEYDFIITNVSSTESEYIPFLKMRYPETPVAACLDYSFEIMSQYGHSGEAARMMANLSLADHVFSVHTHQKAWLEAVMPGVKVTHSPHPVGIETIRKFAGDIPVNKNTYRVCVMWHQYDDRYLSPLFLLRALEQEMGKTIEIAIAGLKPPYLKHGVSIQQSLPPCPNCGTQGEGKRHPPFLCRAAPFIDPETNQTNISLPAPNLTPLPQVKTMLDDKTLAFVGERDRSHSFDFVFPYTSPADWFSLIKNCDLIIDFNDIHSIGRTFIEAAVIGVPAIGNSRVQAARDLHPDCLYEPEEPAKLKAKIKKLLTSKQARDKAVRKAMRNVEMYGFPATKKRFEAMVGQKV